MQVFDDHEHRLLRGQSPHQGQQHLEGPLPLLLRQEGAGGIALGRQRQRHEVGEQGHGLLQGELGLRQEGLQLREGGSRGGARPPLEPALEELGDGIQRRVLVVRHPPALPAQMGLVGHVVLQHLHQAGLPNAGLARQHHHLAHARLDPRPALPQDRHLRRPTHQRGQPAGRGHLQATLRPTGSQHAIHLQRLLEPAERLLSQRLTGEIARNALIGRR